MNNFTYSSFYAKSYSFFSKYIRKLVVSAAFAILTSSILYQTACNRNPQGLSAAALEGKTLAAQYCQSCHQLPDPALLDKKTWKTLLPEMGYYLGIRSPGVSVITEQDSAFYPDKPAMEPEEWESILHYYDAAAPVVMPASKPEAISRAVPFFSMLPTPKRFIQEKMMTSFVKIDTSVQPARVLMYDTASEQLFLLDHQLQPLDSVRMASVVDMDFSQAGPILVCTIGNQLSMGADNDKLGTVRPLRISAAGKLDLGKPLFSKLARPVKVQQADLDGDKKTDVLICEFGKLTGSLIWMKNLGNGRYQRRIIRNLPGSADVHIETNARSGLPDLWVLFAQGEEGIFHFINKGNGRFEQKQVLRFPPSYGSTSFEMADLNGDGLKDIAYTCGDNGDGTRILKPYHGVYLFMNDGKNNFSQNYFYPLHGSYDVIAKDFEGTGRADLAAIAYFNDEKHPEDWFVYLKNQGNFDFKPFGFPGTTNFEKALSMDSGDLNGDGKPDLIIGSAFLNKYLYDERPMFTVLQNTF